MTKISGLSANNKNMFKVIKGKELQELLDKHLICLRCGANKGEKGGCSSWGKSWKRHIYK